MWVPKGGVPVGDVFEANTGEMLLAVGFPVSASIRVAIQGQLERANWAGHALPRLGPLLLGKFYPRFCAFELGLDVGLLIISLHDVAALKATITVSGF